MPSLKVGLKRRSNLEKVNILTNIMLSDRQ